MSPSTRRSSSSRVKIEYPPAYATSNSLSSRPSREAKVKAQDQIHTYREDDDDEILDEDDEQDIILAEEAQHDPAFLRGGGGSGRTRKPPIRYRGEDEFEDGIGVDTSPIRPPVESRRASARRGGRKSYVDPDEDDEEEFIEEIAVVNSPPLFTSNRPTRNRNSNGNGNNSGFAHPAPPQSRSRQQQRQRQKSKPQYNSDEEGEGDFLPSATPSASEDPLQEPYSGHSTVDSEDDLESASPAPLRRTTRSRTSARQATKNGKNRRVSLREESPPRKLRERTSKVNYQLPPLDISAELLPDAIARASGPGRRVGNGLGVGFANGTRFGAGASGKAKGLGWNVRGRDLAHAMGDMDSSDSVSQSIGKLIEANEEVVIRIWIWV